MSRATDGVSFSNISATTAAFTLAGGLYGIDIHATWSGGNSGLQRLMADGTTYVAVHTAMTADGYTTAYLPAGTYKIAVTTATALYANVANIQIG